MHSNNESFSQQLSEASTEIVQLIGRLFEVAEPGAVYSEPQQHGDYVIVKASEVVVGMGVGFGGGMGPEGHASEEEAARTASGMGGGGGGYAHGRPVATITVGPRGVEVQPVVDATKLGIALLTTLAAMSVTLLQVIRTLRESQQSLRARE